MKKFWNATKICASIIIDNFYFPQGSQTIRQKFTKKPSVADPVAVFHTAQGLPFQGASHLMKTNTTGVPEVGICSGMTKNKSCIAAKPLLRAALVEGDQTTLPMVKRQLGGLSFKQNGQRFWKF